MNQLNHDNNITRRQAIKQGVLGAAALTFLDPHKLLAESYTALPKAKSVIQIWMWGGPSQIDTFDPKPGAGYDYNGPLDQAISTNVSGIQVGQLLPKLAKQADKYSIIRSMTHGVNAHETASYLVQTGHKAGRVVYPSTGAVVSLFKGYDQGYKGIVPPYIVLTEPQGRFSEAGFLGQKYKPFCTGGNPNQDPFVVEGIVAEGISDERQKLRRNLLHSLDTLGVAIPNNPYFNQLDKCEEYAYDLMFGKAREIFNLSNEKDETRDQYGRSTFGQSCLMARRLVEIGVPYITINYKGWDTHKQHFQTMNQKLPEMDQGMAALLEDLAQRGLLDSTVVWWGGEFGRTPKVQWEPPWNGGRGHFGQCFSSVIAGGGFAGGHIIGSSDSKASEVRDRPVSPRDLIRSIYQQLGIDPDGTLPNDSGLEVPVLPPSELNESSDGPLKEIMA